jgi:hypothetical protein
MTSVPTIEDNTACTFWKLPPEVRDMIYRYVCGGDRKISMAIRSFWTSNERFERHMNPWSYVVCSRIVSSDELRLT